MMEGLLVDDCSDWDVHGLVDNSSDRDTEGTEGDSSDRGRVASSSSPAALLLVEPLEDIVRTSVA
jgi:hypothetical protein